MPESALETCLSVKPPDARRVEHLDPRTVSLTAPPGYAKVTTCAWTGSRFPLSCNCTGRASG